MSLEGTLHPHHTNPRMLIVKGGYARAVNGRHELGVSPRQRGPLQPVERGIFGRGRRRAQPPSPKTEHLPHGLAERWVDDAVENEVGGEIDGLHEVRNQLDDHVCVTVADVPIDEISDLLQHLRRSDEEEEHQHDADESDGDPMVRLLVGGGRGGGGGPGAPTGV